MDTYVDKTLAHRPMMQRSTDDEQADHARK